MNYDILRKFSKDKENDLSAIYGWSLDMLRAINEHSKLRKWILEKILGRYAKNELMGLQEMILRTKPPWFTKMGYGLKDIDYHLKLDKLHIYGPRPHY